MNIVDLIKEWLISFCDPIMYMESDDKDIKDMMNAFYDRCINVNNNRIFIFNFFFFFFFNILIFLTLKIYNFIKYNHLILFYTTLY